LSQALLHARQALPGAGLLALRLAGWWRLSLALLHAWQPLTGLSRPGLLMLLLLLLPLLHARLGLRWLADDRRQWRLGRGWRHLRCRLRGQRLGLLLKLWGCWRVGLRLRLLLGQRLLWLLGRRPFGLLLLLLLRLLLRARRLARVTAFGRWGRALSDARREPWRRRERRRHSERQQAIPSSGLCLQNLGQDPLLALRRCLARADTFGMRLPTYCGRTLMPQTAMKTSQNAFKADKFPRG
jgi:hypothetical protein